MRVILFGPSEDSCIKNREDIADAALPLSKRANAFADLMGKTFVIGRVTGVVRVIYGVAKTVLCGLGVIFIGLGAVIYNDVFRREKKGIPILAALLSSTGDGIEHIGRGLIEAIPVVGYHCPRMIDSLGKYCPAWKGHNEW